MMSQDYKGSLFAVLSGFLYGFIGYFGISAINASISESNMLFWRFLISSISILILLIPKIKSIRDSYGQLFLAFINGALYYGISTLLYFLSCRYIGSGLAMVMFFTYPVMIMVLNYFFYGQVIPKVYYLAILIILTGMLLLIDRNEIAVDFLGIFIAVSSAFFYACYLISSKKNKIAPDVSALMVCLGCMITSCVVALFNNTFEIPTTPTVWFNLLGIAIVATVVPILLMLHSLKYISSEKASILSVLEPVFVVIFGVVLLGEEMHSRYAFGIVFILSGALLTLFSHKLNLSMLRYRSRTGS